MTKIYPNSVDMTDAEDLASEKRDIAKAFAHLKKQKQQYYDKKYKYLGGIYFVKTCYACWDILKVFLVMCMGGAVVFYFMKYVYETTDNIYLTYPTNNQQQDTLTLPEELPKTGI